MPPTDMGAPKADIDVVAAKAAAYADESPTKKGSSSFGKRGLIIGAIAVVAVLGIGLGVGLGVGLKKDKDSNNGPTVRGARFDPNLKTIYVAAQQVQWKYGGENDQGDSCIDKALYDKAPHVHGLVDATGGTFLKAQYVQYTDDSFKTSVARPANQQHLGLLGPLIYAEAGSTIQVVFRNNLPDVTVNMEPAGGLTWTQPGPGFLPGVLPGETAVYQWQVPDEESIGLKSSPESGTQNSRLFMYHSSFDPTSHDNLGLLGPIIVIAKGQANPDGTAKGVDRDIITLYQVVGEHLSPYVYKNAATVPKDVITTKMVINGYGYCNLPGLEMVQGEKVRWHVAAIGGQVSTHNYHWHGNTLLHNGHRMDHINLLGTNTASLDLSNDAPGTWLFHCHVNAHMSQGMQALYTVKPAPSAPAPEPLNGVVRTYYIQAEETIWNYAPQNGLLCSGELEPFDEAASVFLGPPSDADVRIGSEYIKAVYKQYTDDKFTTPVPRPANEAYMGLIGPIIRADVGDTIKVVFQNKLRYYASMHPHGVHYTKANEGSPYRDGTTEHDDDLVAPNATYTYTWEVRERSGPGPADPSSMIWLYHSHVDEAADTYAGLLGGIVINRAGAAPATPGTGANPGAAIASDVDEEAFFFFNVVDEYNSRYNDDNLQKYFNASMWNTEEAEEELEHNELFLESSLKHSINGYMYCNMPRANFTAYKRIRFHVLALGSLEDVHSPSIGGGTFLTLGHHSAAMIQLAGSMQSQDVMFTEDGTFNIACRVADHVMAGMEALYNVLPGTPPNAITGGKLKQYFIQAEEREWNYAPQGYVQCTNQDMYAVARPFVESSDTNIGPKRAKALFIPYTDANFATEKQRPPYMGLMGPLIGLEVGDTLEVTLKNKLEFDVSFAPDGGFDALHDATAGKAVAPGQTFTYRFVVPEKAGPINGDLSTTTLMYVSDVDIPSHTAAGLLGVMVVAAQGGLKEDGITPKDADFLLPLHFQVFNENASPLYEKQVATVDPLFKEFVGEDDNMMSSINGFIYCNMPSPTVPKGSNIRVVFSAFGSEEAMFSPRILGQTLTISDGALSSQQLLAAVSTASNVKAVTAGKWPIVDDIHEHQDKGMIASLIVSDVASRKMKMM